MLTGRGVLITIFVFFGVIFSANALMVYFALDSWSGLSTDDAYRKGRHFNDVISAGNEQTKRGWLVDVKSQTNSALEIALQVNARTADGAAINGLDMIAILKRPVRPDIDQRIALKGLGDGKYTGTGKLPARGQWTIELNANRSGKQMYRSINRIKVK